MSNNVANTGNLNTGDWNAGHWNDGYFNTGNWNAGHWNDGYFNTKTPKKIKVFGKNASVKIGIMPQNLVVYISV